VKVRKYRWSKHYESAEEELVGLLTAKGISAERWTADSNEIFAAHSHSQDTRLWCADGTIVFTVDGKRFSLQPGDTLDIPANTMHEATVGLFGCVCYVFPSGKCG
jgi:quercetin dioxygenase-like cupin family protein